ncbi:PQQ-binding-like beta-propeller repeat protein [Leifsonia sp. CL147]|uniref:outer membrane protein assembly factor BamB family protein n=1 Tax=Leifsonia sp. CL147 TaxID=1798215 RepID=UPI00147F31C5|nr:PQQ-binding-like beta-propeller repeat protein [Leifsonia sp. CL147]
MTAVTDSKNMMIVAGGDLTGVDPTTGAHLWQRHEPLVGCAPTALNGSAYCYVPGAETTSPITVLRVRLSDGQVLSTFQLPSANTQDGVERIAVLGGAVILVDATVAGGDSIHPYKAIVHRLPADLAGETWRTVVPDPRQSNDSGTWPDIARVESGVLVLNDGYADMVLNFDTGGIIHAGMAGAEDVLADGRVVANPDAETPTGTAPHGYVRPADKALQPVDFSGSAQAPPAPLYFTVAPNNSDNTLPVNAYAADGNTPLWRMPVTMVGDPQWLDVYAAADKGLLVLTDTAGHVNAVDPKKGTLLWSNSYDAPERGDGGADMTKPTPYFLDDNTVVIADYDKYGGKYLHAFSAATGTALWTLNGVGITGTVGTGLRFVQDDSGFGPLVGTTTTTPASLPGGLPSCPTGMTPISWSTYPGGHVLLCAGSGRYQADVTINRKTVNCTALDFTAGGYVLRCGDGASVRALGGIVFQFTVGSKSWVQPAAAAWSVGVPSHGISTGFGSAPQTLPVSCPAGAIPLSLSTWHGGWLLICGTDALHVTSFTYRSDSGGSTGSDMTFQNGVYCGTDQQGTSVCASGVPAVVTITPRGATPTQFSADANYFPSTGNGGAGEGTGAYGVAAPKATADDQVRYLMQILQKSQQGRATVGGLVANLLRCSVATADVASAHSVVTNRQQLVDALTSAPVDEVPGGSQLIAELKQALSVSLRADTQYQSAAQQMSSGDCTSGLNTAKAAIDVANTTDALKQTFADDWNTNIVGKYAEATTIDPNSL